MKKFTTRKGLQQHLDGLRAEGKIIGLVPTMGALHPGHLSLISTAQQQCDIVVCSIFVNPTQFNDPKDLEIYPRPINDDIRKLEEIKCDVLFNPAIYEIYDNNEQWHLDIGETEHLLEGKFRPGHYQGVTHVVSILLDIMKPNAAFFGQKDYQQFLVINQMINLLHIPVRLVLCPTLRETDGLAMSSRNILLTPQDRQHALILSKTLNRLKENFTIHHIAQLKKEAERAINDIPDVELEYVEIADGDTLHPADKNSKKIVALIAAKVGNTRLIDNIILKQSTSVTSQL